MRASDEECDSVSEFPPYSEAASTSGSSSTEPIIVSKQLWIKDCLKIVQLFQKFDNIWTTTSVWIIFSIYYNFNF